MNIKYYTDIDITFCRQRSLSLSFPSLNNINFFPPIILPQPSSNGRTHTVSQSTLREPSFFKVTEPSYVRNRNSISEFQTDHCTYRVKLILWHLLSYLFIHVSLPLVLEAFSITPLPVLSQTIFFPFVIPLCFSELIYNSPTCPLMTALRMGGSWPVLTHTHTVNSGDYPTASSFIQSSLHLHRCTLHAKGFKCSQLLPQAAGYRLQGDFVSCMVVSKKQE